MLDKVVLCKEGSVIYEGLRKHTYSLQTSSVQVYFVPGSISGDLSDVTWKDNLSGLTGKVLLTSKHSMLTELHVVAYGAAGGTATGHYIALVVGGTTCLAIAYSEEAMTCNEKLFLTFDFEETKGVLTAKADFDGTITQGILEEILSKVAKSGSYEDLSNTPVIPAGANDARVTVYAGDAEVGSFTVNQNEDSTLDLGSASVKYVDTTIGDVPSEDNLPTSHAVADYVSGVVNDVSITIKKHSDDESAVGSFTTNDGTAREIVLGYGSAADLDAETSSLSASDNAKLPTSKVVADYVSGQIGTGSLTINKGGKDNTSTPFSANATDSVTINLGLGSAADLDSTTSLSASDDNKLPTSKAVADYVGAQGFLTAELAGISDQIVTIYRNSSNDADGSLVSFTLNQKSDAPIELGLGFGNVVKHDAVGQISSSDASSSSIPTAGAVVGYVGTGVLTIQKNNEEVGTFSANANSASTINIDVPTKLSELIDENGVLSSIPGYAVYDSETKTISFKKDKNSETLFDLDATAFVKDGMVSKVEISDANLVVTFNADAEKSDISIPLADIFDPSNYYTSSQTDSAISTAISNLQLGDASKKNVASSITSTSSDNLPTTSAVTTYINEQKFAKAADVGNGKITIKKNSNDTGFSFELNQSDSNTLDLGLGDSAYQGVATQIVSGDTSEDLPTSHAVASFVEDQGYITDAAIGTANLKIYKGAISDTADCTFSANAKKDVDLALGLGSAAYLASADTLDSSSSDIPTSSAVASYIEGLGHAKTDDVGDGELLIRKYKNGTSLISTGFTANIKEAKTVDLGLGAAADMDVDDSIVVPEGATAASNNLPTSEAVRAFVEGKGYLTSVSNAQISLVYNDPSKGADQTSEFGVFTLNGDAQQIVFGSAAHAEIVSLSETDTIDTVQNQDTYLLSLGQAKTLISNATEPKTVSPSDAPASGSQNGITIPVGAMVWLALNFSGSVGIMDFTTVSSNPEGTGTPLLSGNGSNAQVIAYMAQIRDNAGDFYALEDQKLAAGQKFRTTNCMDSSGMAVPSYGFALCVRLPDDSTTNG